MPSAKEIKDKELVEVTCSTCQKPSHVTYGHYRRNKTGAFYCRTCAQQIRAQGAKTSWDKRSDEDKSMRIAKMQAAISKSMTPEKKELVYSKLRDVKIEQARANMTDIQREVFGDRWSGLTQAERDRTSFDIKCGDCGINFEITYGQFRRYGDDHHWRCKKCRYEHHAIEMRLLDIPQKYLRELSTEELSQIRHRALSTGARGSNAINKKFENMFRNSTLVNQFKLVPEISININSGFKHWDYGIYDIITNELVMVIDIDGAFFHADNCDYNGLHSREEYDERRSLFIPEGVKCHIIYEERLTESFAHMLKGLILNYDEFINDIFIRCRLSPFPSPCYTDNELQKSWKQLQKLNCDNSKLSLSTRNREGDRIINHFHESIFHAKCKGSRLSPYDAWHDDRLLMKVIENRIIYQSYLNPNKILQGFNICKVASKVSVFSAGRAKLLIHKYLNEYNEIFDPFSGFSGRMLGTLSSGNTVKYIGHDISPIHVRESNEIIKYFGFNNRVLVSQEDAIQSSGNYQSLFTCPPYGDKEQWENIPVDKRSCDDWIDICLNNFKCNKYLFVVDNTNKYKHNIVDVIENKSHFGKNDEYVILI